MIFQAYFSLNTSILGTFLHIERPYWTGNGTAPQSKSFLEPEKISESKCAYYYYYYYIRVYNGINYIR